MKHGKKQLQNVVGILVYNICTSTSKTKKVFKAKCLGPLYGTKCILQCNSKITEEDGKAIFSDYWHLSDLQRQREFILKSMEMTNPKYQCKRVPSNRINNHAFYFTINGTKSRVCKKFHIGNN